jgi:malonate-semialdehyde dehydrogenase (acetylating) / methylmalonate-semialdehyde dehydrogenase
MDAVHHWIGGSLSAGVGTRTGDVYDPATGQVTKQVRLGSSADVDAAVAAAEQAFPE